MPEFKEGGVISLQYADDTILFSNPGEQMLKNLKCTLVRNSSMLLHIFLGVQLGLSLLNT
jgi:hypothetical protein